MGPPLFSGGERMQSIVITKKQAKRLLPQASTADLCLMELASGFINEVLLMPEGTKLRVKKSGAATRYYIAGYAPNGSDVAKTWMRSLS